MDSKKKMLPPNGQEEWKDFYGGIEEVINPNKRAEWWESNIEKIELPFILRLAWDRTQNVRYISVNKKIAGPIINVFYQIDQQGLAVFVTEFGGTFSLRRIRGSSRWSTHSWAASIDLNPETNKLYEEPTMHKEVVEIFELYGFTWGGNFSRKDGMHFQFGKDF